MTAGMVGHVVLTFKVHEEDGQYVSRCEELGVASCGDTIQEAFDSILDATLVYLDTLQDEGERERVFAERGIEVIPGAPPTDAGEIALKARPNEYVSPQTIPIPVGAA